MVMGVPLGIADRALQSLVSEQFCEHLKLSGDAFSNDLLNPKAPELLPEIRTVTDATI